ncbi:MAG: hypothetical protein C4521_01840 [Actinobacteria bacterium]|nr:MAG: hypothetical protein C4521_01840 [Actinomycetota bacterium]
MGAEPVRAALQPVWGAVAQQSEPDVRPVYERD